MEVAAAQHVARWVGDVGSVVDTGDGPGPDFRIDYLDGRLAWGEVAWNEDRETQALLARIAEVPPLPLPDGLRQWAVHLLPKAMVKDVIAEAPALIADLHASGRIKLAPHDDVTPSEYTARAERLGIEDLHQMGSGGADEALLLSPFDVGSGGNVDSVVDWIESMLASDQHRDTTEKLLIREADERHVFLFVGSLTLLDAAVAMARPLTSLPTRPPRLPSGITHVWALSPMGRGELLVWNERDGWKSIEIDNAEG